MGLFIASPIESNANVDRTVERQYERACTRWYLRQSTLRCSIDTLYTDRSAHARVIERPSIGADDSKNKDQLGEALCDDNDDLLSRLRALEEENRRLDQISS
jgi:hypothetical protein